MINNFKDLAVQYVKTIADCNRCGLCDISDGTRMRFACGHSACVDCVAVAADCPTCSPLVDSSSNRPRSDLSLTERVKNATELLTSFQVAFDIDVYQRQRISERLRVEKELFPECVQAPSKYFNKRKSLNASTKNKENSYTFFPGEEISSKQGLTMNKSSYVQDWLNKQTTSFSPPSRSPFSNLQVNTHHKEAISNLHTVKGKEKPKILNKSTQQSYRKSSRLKQSISSNAQSNLEKYLKPVEKSQSKKRWMSTKKLKQDLGENIKGPGKNKVLHKTHCDESGIVIDDDCFTIEDTQNQIIDKDRLALLAVANADAVTTSSSVVEDSQVIHDVNWGKESTPTTYNDQKNKLNAVPFYRKSYLFENCNQCIDNDTVNVIKPKLHEDGLKNDTNISITVENKSFITTITVLDCTKSNSDKKQSTSVQTDVEQPFLGFEQTTLKETVKMISKIQDYIHSESMFTEKMVPETDSQKTTCTDVVLTKYNAENNLAEGGIVANHQTEHGFGILTEIGTGFQNRKRKPPRGVTPDSNNSSDKENCDPNRKKKNDAKKKKKVNK